jgi:hypothetical protein
LTGKEHIIPTDRFPDRLEFSVNGSDCARVFFVEERPFDGPGKESLESLRSAIFALALRDAMPELERHDR